MKTVFVDVDTQIDFMFAAGALYVPGAETVLDRVAFANRYAAARGIPVISSVDAHAEDDPEFAQYPHHCVISTVGQRKCAKTLVDSRAIVPNVPGPFSIVGAKQIVVEKQTFDVFSNVNFRAILDELGADRYVVYGVVTEICVKFAALGLRRLGAKVEIAADAIRGLTADAEAKALAEFAEAGCTMTTVADFCAN